MAKINNSGILRKLKNVAGINEIFDKIPTELADKIIPVLDINPLNFPYINDIEIPTITFTGNQTLNLFFTGENDFLLIGDIIANLGVNDGTITIVIPLEENGEMDLLDSGGGDFTNFGGAPLKIRRNSWITVVQAAGANWGAFTPTINFMKI